VSLRGSRPRLGQDGPRPHHHPPERANEYNPGVSLKLAASGIPRAIEQYRRASGCERARE